MQECLADYCDIDPVCGDLAAFDRLVTAAHARGLRILLDWVPNHTSDQHAWFQSSRLDPAGPHAHWYWWADRPMNNWPSAFGGSAWTFDEVRWQYFLHLFTPAQPDLNWNDPGGAINPGCPGRPILPCTTRKHSSRTKAASFGSTGS